MMEVYQAYCGGIFKKVKAKKLAHEKIKAIFDRKTECIGSFLGFIKISQMDMRQEIQSTLGFATMGKAANLGLATRNAMTDLF